MVTFKFDETLHLKNRIIDREHAILFEHINTLQDVINGASSRHLIGQVLEGLVEYTKTHFYVEEELMLSFNYPGYSDHKTAHTKFKNTMNQLLEQYQRGETDIGEELMNMLKDWLVNHIQKIDAQLAEFLKGKVLG